jgi:hypothetical protein
MFWKNEHAFPQMTTKGHLPLIRYSRVHWTTWKVILTFAFI